MTDLLIFRDDVLEKRAVDLPIISFLLEVNAINLLCLDGGRNVGRVDLQNGSVTRHLCLGKLDTWRTQYLPAFFLRRTSRASGEYPGAMIPSDTSREMIRAVAKSQGADNAMKSPNDDIRSAPDHERACVRDIGYSSLVYLRTASSRISRGQRSEGFFQIIHTVNFLLRFIELKTDSRASRRDMFKRCSRRDMQRFLKLFDQRIRVQGVKEVNVSRRARKDCCY